MALPSLLTPALLLLLVAGAFGCAQSAPARRTFLLKDNGVRCIRAPCPSIDAISPGAAPVAVTGVALEQVLEDPSAREQALSKVHQGGLTAEGYVDASSEKGPIFRVTRLP
jgi:hypothetical protein